MSTDRGYEFSDDENVQLSGLASVMTFVSRFQLLLGFVLVGAGLLMVNDSSWGVVIALVSQGAFNLAVALWVIRGARAFEHVVDTEGEDIPHLMSALGELRKVFNLQRIMILVALLAALVGTAFIMFPIGEDTVGDPSHDGTHGAPPAPASTD